MNNICGCCGKSVEGAPMDFAFGLPEAVFGLSKAERARRATVSSDVVLLDRSSAEERTFVRALLPVPMSRGREFRFGLWLEVGRAAAASIAEVWGEPRLYKKLRFEATIGNTAGSAGLGASLLGCFAGLRSAGGKVRCAVRKVHQRPFVVGADEEATRELLQRGWSDADYHEFLRFVDFELPN